MPQNVQGDESRAAHGGASALHRVIAGRFLLLSESSHDRRSTHQGAITLQLGGMIGLSAILGLLGVRATRFRATSVAVGRQGWHGPLSVGRRQ
jgi:hypothetical protein